MQKIDYAQLYTNPVTIALGFFDCMHLGHLALIDSAKQIASRTDSQVAIMTFSNNHFAQLGKDTKLIYSINERYSIYQSVGVDVVVSAHFDKQFMMMTAQQYLDRLTSNKNVVGIVVGYDHCCGSDRKDSNWIAQYCHCNNIICSVVPEVLVGDKKVSSTLIRHLLECGDIANVNSLLSQPYHIQGKVVHGRGIGSTIGFATANLQVDSDKLLPKGVYSGTVNLDNQKYRAIINIGNAPTFEVDNNNCEVHIIGYNGNLYGTVLTVALDRFLRDIMTFESVEQLQNQLAIDKKEACND